MMQCRQTHGFPVGSGLNSSKDCDESVMADCSKPPFLFAPSSQFPQTDVSPKWRRTLPNVIGRNRLPLRQVGAPVSFRMARTSPVRRPELSTNNALKEVPETPRRRHWSENNENDRGRLRIDGGTQSQGHLLRNAAFRLCKNFKRPEKT